MSNVLYKITSITFYEASLEKRQIKKYILLAICLLMGGVNLDLESIA